MKREGLNKVKNRKKLWDLFKWNYVESAHYLWKNTMASCNCKYCKMLRLEKRRSHKRDRVKLRNELTQLIKG